MSGGGGKPVITVSTMEEEEEEGEGGLPCVRDVEAAMGITLEVIQAQWKEETAEIPLPKLFMAMATLFRAGRRVTACLNFC